jgi:error-prone DNA polymerase
VGRHPYAELHCHSNFSFLDGASHPEELVEEAARLELDALALTDHDGVYGVVRFARAAAEAGLPTVFGAELTLGLAKPATRQAATTGHRQGPADPPGHHLVVLARDPEGYSRLCRALSRAQLAGGDKGWPTLSLGELADLHGGHWLVTTACRKGAVPRALVSQGPAAAARCLDELVGAFGRPNLAVECWDHGDPLDGPRNDALAELALSRGLEVVATNNVHYATPSGHRVAAALAAVRARSCLDRLDGWLPGAPGAHLRSGAEQARRFARWPGAVEAAAELGRQCAFDLGLVAPRLPDFPVPPGHDEQSWLVHLVEEGAAARYGPRSRPGARQAWARVDHELEVIGRLGFAGYFLVVWDIVEMCRRSGIYCQGRGSAANSVVCHVLGITKADPVALGLLFERFLSSERDGPPDIDVDIEAGRREEVIRYVYQRYGRDRAAQVANVVTYRARSAVRDMGRALGYSPGQLDAWSKGIDRWEGLAQAGGIPPEVVELAAQVEDFPRHLGIHSGGMVICDRPVSEVCPVEWGRAQGRSVLQWDKEDCAAAGLVKFDLLGLGMLSALHNTVELIQGFYGAQVDLSRLPQEPEVYEMLCRADTVGVFQVESRAQMATLPRLRPRCFYDLVVEVALIRPGPIQGGSVHPYLRRRAGAEPVQHLHPLLEPALARTLGVPLFQEQLMQMAIDVAGFSPAEADRLRQAMGSKRSARRMEQLKGRFYAGMAERGIGGEVADAIWEKMAGFASFGFPESHAVSFAYLVYASAWLKLHYPAAFCAGLLNSQPMGFWAPRTLVADARRHGVEVRRPDVDASGAQARLEDDGRGGAAVRLGLSYVRGLGREAAERVAAGAPYSGLEDLARRAGLTREQLEALATAGALGQVPRRQALWAAGPASRARPGTLPGLATTPLPPRLPPMSQLEEMAADLWATGVSPDHHPLQFLRPALRSRGVQTAAGLAGLDHGARVEVAGVVTHRQRPSTAGGTVFLNLEDETGMVNVICSRGLWLRHRPVAAASPALVVRGRLERAGGALNLVAERLTALRLPVASASRDFR